MSPPPIWTNSQVSLIFRLESFPNGIVLNPLLSESHAITLLFKMSRNTCTWFLTQSINFQWNFQPGVPSSEHHHNPFLHHSCIREAFQTKKRGNLGKDPKWRWPPGLELSLTWDFLKVGWPPKIVSKQVEYEKYWNKISQYEWYNDIFGHV